MRSAVRDILPPSVRRSLTKLGADIRLARRRRSLTVQMMCERLAVAKTTYLRVEKGDPSVAIGGYAMALFALGLGAQLGELADPQHDDQGLAFDTQRLPQRVRARKRASTP